MKLRYIVIAFLTLSLGLSACTDDFEEMNTDPNAFTAESASPVFFVSKILHGSFAQDRYAFWRGPLIHGERYADFVRFGHSPSWWTDGLGYSYHDGYTNAYWSENYVKVSGNINEYMKLVGKKGIYENEKLEAVGMIMHALYYQLMTDSFGDIPMTEAGLIEFLTPKYDGQKEIYITLIDNLGEAITIIGDEESSGVGVQDLAQGDVLYNGDLQKWKKLANSLRLRMAMRAQGAVGADFAEQAITTSLAEDLISTNDEAALLVRDLGVSQWDVTGFESIWWDFYWTNAARWTMSYNLVTMLREANDPRLAIYAKPAQGGTLKFTKTDVDDYEEKIGIVKQLLAEVNATYTEGSKTVDGVEYDSLIIAKDTYYIGQPARFNNKIKPFLKFELFSTPSELVVGEDTRTKQIKPTLVFSTAEAFFLQAEAALKGLGAGSPQDFFQKGIEASMEQWGVSEGEIATFLATPNAQLTGTTEEKFGQVATQRWVANFGNGFEAWAVMRDTGYPMSVTVDIPDDKFHDDGTVGRGIPQRMRYPSSEEALNPENVREAMSKLSDGNTQKSKLWWAL